MALREADPRNIIALVGACREVPYDALLWIDPPGIGVCLAGEQPLLYGEAYWSEYRHRDQTDMGRLLTNARANFVRRFYQGRDLVDVGIGGGRFVMHMNGGTSTFDGTYGYDINPLGVAWLKELDLYKDPFSWHCDAVTMWDSLEHAIDWTRMFRSVTQWAFISTPIYSDCTHCRHSKHFKPGEHVWYFTDQGLRWYMHQQGFAMHAFDHFEIALGRTSIGTYAFRRFKPLV